MSRKFLSILIIFTFLLSLLPVNVHAATVNTNVTIHKITGTTEHQATFGELTNTTPPTGDPISNISFTYWKVTETQFNTMKNSPGSYQTVDQVTTLAGAPVGTTAKTQADGTVTVNGLAEGYYWFIEDPSTAVATSNAVPFGLDLPVTNEAGTGYITDLHVFPKNTLEATPTIDKDVVSDRNKSATFDIGQSFDWLIQPTTPKGINEYTKFTVTDQLDAALTLSDPSKITAAIGSTTLTPGTDFNATYDVGTRNLTVDFTTAGLQKIGSTNQTTGLTITVPTTINNQAIMGKNISNTAKLLYENGHGTTGTTSMAAQDNPEVHTGGKNFVKTNGSGTNLQGAEFVVKNESGQYLQQDSTTLVIAWGDRSSATTFTSNSNGQFEVKGLAYGNYQVEETKAPTGYTIPTNPLTAFTVDSTSYYTDATAVTDASTAATATPLEIINKQSYIPNTGGIGTIIFTVVGVLLMLTAIVLFRKRNKAS